jgi:hypothetical protein
MCLAVLLCCTHWIITLFIMDLQTQSVLNKVISLFMCFWFKVVKECVQLHLRYFVSNCNMVTQSVTGKMADNSMTLIGGDC